ncbi:MAG TPA: sugar phosphate isomerase/epimerase [Lacunisphaera sp.]|nr:sugar phosphate isomerase/epimerase [Lacunisphaera sp.]
METPPPNETDSLPGIGPQVSGLVSRREALLTLAAGATLPLLGARAVAETSAPPAALRALPFKLGVASYTLRGMPLENALQAVRRVGLDSISVNRAHLPWENLAPDWPAQLAKFTQAGVKPGCAGVFTVKDDEAEMRRAFDYIKGMGVPVFSCNPTPDALPRLERFVREYDVLAAIHNHGPENKAWPSPHEPWRAIQSLDSRIGLCIDVGHTYRAGADPVQCIRDYRARVYDIHLKDTAVPVGTKKDEPLEVGRGNLDIRGILQALIDTGFSHSVWFEYEKSPDDVLPGLAESVGYVRGLLRGMGFTAAPRAS